MKVRTPRTPKVKEFVHAPFGTCPDCGTVGTFGVLMCLHMGFLSGLLTLSPLSVKSMQP